MAKICWPKLTDEEELYDRIDLNGTDIYMEFQVNIFLSHSLIDTEYLAKYFDLFYCNNSVWIMIWKKCRQCSLHFILERNVGYVLYISYLEQIINQFNIKKDSCILCNDGKSYRMKTVMSCTQKIEDSLCACWHSPLLMISSPVHQDQKNHWLE